MVRTDGDAEIRVDEGVVDQVRHILEGFPMVFAGTVREQQLQPQTAAVLYPQNGARGVTVQVFLTSYRGWTGQNAP